MAEFLGVKSRELFFVSEGAHRMAFAVYVFPDGTERAYIEATEVSTPEHEASGPFRRCPLAETVHALQNITEREFFAIGNRDPWEST